MTPYRIVNIFRHRHRFDCESSLSSDSLCFQFVGIIGKNSFIWTGPTPTVNIVDPDQIKEIFSKNYEYLRPSYKSSPIGVIVTGLVSAEGEKWARHRKIIHPAFHLEKLKNMLPAFYLSCTEMIDKWEKLTSPNGSCEVDVWPYLQNVTSDVISRTAFGSSYDEGRRIFELLKELTVLALQARARQSVFMPRWRFLPTKLNKRTKEIDGEIKLLLRGIVNGKEEAMKAGETANDDLLGLLLKSNREEVNGMSIDDVIEECKVFYLAGHETTAVLLVWTMVLLGEYQEWQERARDEVFQVFGKEKPDFNGLNHLKIITMIFYEVLRLYPPAYVLPRVVPKEMKLGKLTLPAVVHIQVPTVLVHHDHEIWGDDAKEFKPERFSEGISKATKGQVSFFPFGGGPRICIGQNFALIEAKIALATILQRFSFRLSPSYTHAPSTIMTLQPEHGAHIILQNL